MNWFPICTVIRYFRVFKTLCRTLYLSEFLPLLTIHKGRAFCLCAFVVVQKILFVLLSYCLLKERPDITKFHLYIFQSFLMNATQLFNCDGATKSPPGSGGPPPGGRPASPNLSAVGGADKSNPATHVFIQGWMLMAVAVSIFVPRSSKLLWFLRNHFARNKDSKYVFFDQNAAFHARFNLSFTFLH